MPPKYVTVFDCKNEINEIRNEETISQHSGGGKMQLKSVNKGKIRLQSLKSVINQLQFIIQVVLISQSAVLSQIH